MQSKGPRFCGRNNSASGTLLMPMFLVRCFASRHLRHICRLHNGHPASSLQVAEELHASHCQKALEAIEKANGTRPLTEQDLKLALRLAHHLAKLRAAQSKAATANVSPSYSCFSARVPYSSTPLSCTPGLGWAPAVLSRLGLLVWCACAGLLALDGYISQLCGCAGLAARRSQQDEPCHDMLLQ